MFNKTKKCIKLKILIKLLRNLNGFKDLFQNGKVFTDDLQNEDRMYVPVNIKETDKNYKLKVIAPGLDKGDIKVNLEKNILTIAFESKKEEPIEETSKVLSCEYKFKSFKRSFTLSDKIDTGIIEAKYNDGILSIILPKKETMASKTQTIKIN